MVDRRYRTSAGCLYTLKDQLVGCPTYRWDLLTGSVAERLQELLDERAKPNKVVFETLEIMPDHDDVFVSADPTAAPQRMANPFKGHTSRMLRQEFAHLRSRIPALGSRSSYVGRVGHGSEDAIQKYIKAQERRS
jgi:putative transposase